MLSLNSDGSNEKSLMSIFSSWQVLYLRNSESQKTLILPLSSHVISFSPYRVYLVGSSFSWYWKQGSCEIVFSEALKWLKKKTPFRHLLWKRERPSFKILYSKDTVNMVKQISSMGCRQTRCIFLVFSF